MDLETSLFKQGWRGGGDILVVDLCLRAPPLRRRLLQRQRRAWEVVQERMQIVVCIGGIWKMVDRVLGSWYVDGRYGFLLRRLNTIGCQIWSSMACPGCCLGLIRQMVLVLPRGPQSCISTMKPRRARVSR